MGRTNRSPKTTNSSDEKAKPSQGNSGQRPGFEWQDKFDPGDGQYGRVPNPFPGLVPANPNSPIYAKDEDEGYGLDSSIIGFEIEKISVSRCHVCISFTYTIGFIQYPTSTVCYIKPECQPPDSEPEQTTFTPDPRMPPDGIIDLGQYQNIDFPMVPSGSMGWLKVQYTGGWNFSMRPGCTHPWDLSAGYVSANSYPGAPAPYPLIPVYPGQRMAVKVFTTQYPYGGNTSGYLFRVFPDGQELREQFRTYTGGDPIRIGEVFAAGFRLIPVTCGGQSNGNGVDSGAAYTSIEMIFDPALPPRPLNPIIPALPTPKPMPSDCCAKTDRLLRLLLRRIGEPKKITIPEFDKAKEKRISSLADAIERWSYHQSNSTADLYKVIEPRAFEGASYPMRLTHAGATGKKPVRNYLQAWEAILRQVDTAVGLLPFKLKIEDTNAAQEGNQSLEVQIHSISDALKLLVENVIDVEGDGDVTNNLLVRMAAMLIQQHQVLAKINAHTRNTEEYLDYKVKQKIEKIPSTLNPLLPSEGQGFGNAGTLDQNTEQATENLMPHLLRNTELKVKVTEIDEKRLLSESLYEILKFASSAAAGNTIHYKGKETLEKLINGLIENDELKEFLDRQNVRKALGGGADLTKFEADAEKGYPSADGLVENDPDKPYGKPFAKRPKIRKTNRRRR